MRREDGLARCIWVPIWENESDGTIRRSDGALHCDHCAISNHSAAIFLRMCPTHKSTAVEHSGAKFWEESVDGFKPNFNAYAYEIVTSFAVGAQCMNVRDRKRDDGTATSLAVCSMAKSVFGDVA